MISVDRSPVAVRGVFRHDERAAERAHHQSRAGNACGKLLRHYWQPAALTEELDRERPVVPVRLLGEDLVLFRDKHARLGLLGRRCPHRGTDLAYARCEDGGLRCVFHGWLFDDRDNASRHRPSRKAAGCTRRSATRAIRWWSATASCSPIWARARRRRFRSLTVFVAPSEYTFAFKGFWDCNWLQALEVGIDPAHASFLHRYFEDEKPEDGYGRQFRDTSSDSDMPMSKVLREFDRPQINVVPSEFGFKLITLRKLNAAQTHVRVTNLVFPNIVNLPLSSEMVLTQFHVPVDDTGCFWYSMFTSFNQPVDKAEMRRQRVQTIVPPDYRSKFNKDNNYGFNAAEQRRETFTGMGHDINVHDQFAVESHGPDLRSNDRASWPVRSRDRDLPAHADRRHRPGRQRRAAADGARCAARRNASPVPDTIDGVGPSDGWDQYWQDACRKRRQGAAWAALAS